jgi:hypothetical protein
MEKTAADVRITDIQSGNDSINCRARRELFVKLQQYVLYGIVFPAALLPGWP